MKVDRELIEKFHRNECTPGEIAAVEAWLVDDDVDDYPELPPELDTEAHKQEMWSNISSTLTNKSKDRKYKLIWLSVAAACVVVIATFCLNGLGDASQKVASMVEVDNTGALKVRHVINNEYQLAVGPGTSASINNREGTIHFNGSMIIKPQRDIQFSFGTYPEKETFKSGETYILLDEQRGDGRVTIVNEKNLVDMPPVLKKRIITDFNI